MNLLVIRLSSMGDVALAVPALKSVLHDHPEVTVTLLTKPSYIPFFEHIDRVKCKAAETKGKHKGIFGLIRLYREIMRSVKPDKVIDLHDVMRSWFLCFLFKGAGIPYWRIDKGRKEKKALARKKNKIFTALKHTLFRYLDVFAAAGFPGSFSEDALGFDSAVEPIQFMAENQLLPKEQIWIGIAPFSKHREKVWPLEKMEMVIQQLLKRGHKIFMLGGGATEIEQLNNLNKKFPELISVAGKLSLREELGLVRQLDLMVSMDSSNMHMGAISKIPVVSIWGATHPYLGFGPINGNEKYIVQIPHKELDCRPCSIIGNKPCFRGDHACMEWIGPDQVLSRIEQALADEKRG